MPLVSIIVPVYNAEKYLRECLDSLITQTYKNLEIICINDGSKDNSLSILEEYARNDNRIKVYSQENSGEATTRNRGLELAKGTYITALDADDYCSENTIETSVELAEKTGCDAVINYVTASKYLMNKKTEDFSFTTMWQIFIRKNFLDKHSDIKFTKDIVLGPDAVYTHKILSQTDNIQINKLSKHFYRYYPEQVSTSIQNQPDKLLYYIKRMLEDIEIFYNDKNLWKIKNDHFMNFLLEHPFYHYMHGDFSLEQKQELFDLVHNIINKYDLKENFTNKNIRNFMFKKFLKCKKYSDFEIYLYIMKVFINTKVIIRKIIKKGAI